MNILYVTPYVPSQIRTRPYNLIQALAKLDHQVTLLTAADTRPEEQAQANAIRNWGVRVEVFAVSLARSLYNCLLALPTQGPLQASYSYHPAMEQRLSELLRENTFDVVHIEHLRASRLVRAIIPPRFEGHVPVVYDSVDCISLLFEQAAQSGAQLRSRLMTAVDLARTQRYEAQLLTQYDQVVVTSQRDKQALEKLARRYVPTNVRIAPVTAVTNGVDLDYFQPSKMKSFDTKPLPPPTIVFSGKMSYHANISAAMYFAQDVLPLIWEKCPEVQFQIVGKDPPEAVRKLSADKRIQVTGTVDDLRPYLAQAMVAVCPALYAVGVQNKVLEAMAMETPVVSTSAGCAGLTATKYQDILVADGQEKFANAVVQVLSDSVLAERLATSGRRYVESHHSWESGARLLVKIYEEATSSAGKRQAEA